jgi:hypothetical protein
LEDFPLPEILNVQGLIPHFKPCLVVKINDIQVLTTKKGLESGFGRVKFENTSCNPTGSPHRVLYFFLNEFMLKVSFTINEQKDSQKFILIPRSSYELSN